MLSAYKIAKVLEKSQIALKDGSGDIDYGELYDKEYLDKLPLFKYIEQVLYSNNKSDIETYRQFYIDLKSILER